MYNIWNTRIHEGRNLTIAELLCPTSEYMKVVHDQNTFFTEVGNVNLT